MGAVVLPAAGQVYLDAQCLIYSVERHPTWAPLLDPLWLAVQAGTLQVVTSDLSLLECLVLPYRRSDAQLIADYKTLLHSPGVDLLPITQDMLRAAAQLRATITKLRTPDALHAATALRGGVALFVTNDAAFRNVPGLPVEILTDALARP